MNAEEELAGHFRDLAARSFANNIYTFSEFLGDYEQDLLHGMEKELNYAGITLFGGRENAERCMARFGKEQDLGYDQAFPIVCLKIAPLVEKFAEDLSHRDYLGALMSLGVERTLLGDIVLAGKTAYLFCSDHIAEYLISSLTKVRHTNVSLTKEFSLPPEALPKLKEQTIIAASERLDAIISGVYHLSRKQSQELCRSGKIFVNGRLCESSSFSCREKDVISVRGFGKFIFDSVTGTTGKGRERIRILLFS